MTPMKTKTPLRYYGGKSKMIKHLLPLIPPHQIYIEPFIGGGALFWVKPPSQREIINDISKPLMNFYRTLRDKFSQLTPLIEQTSYARSTYYYALSIYHKLQLFSKVEQAWAIWTLLSQGHSGIIRAWGYDKQGSSNRSFFTRKKRFSKILSSRLKGVTILNKDGLNVISRYDSPNNFFYCDPPYFNSLQAHYKGYGKEDFKQLLNTLASIKGRFLLSAYPSPLLESYIIQYRWSYTTIEMNMIANKFVTKKKKKVEVLVWNY